MRASRRAISAIGAVAAAAALVAPPAYAAPGFSYGGDRCHEAVIIFEADAERVRPFVPTRYAIGTAGGEPKVAANVATLTCDELTVEGRRTGPWTTASLGVQVRPPDQSFFNNYNIWSPTNNPAIASRWAALGLGERGFVNGLSIETRLGDLASSSTTRVPWSYSPYRLRVDTAGPFTPPADRGFTIWTAGSHGDVVINGSITGERMQIGNATLTAEPGSPLAQILGAETVTGAGLIATFGFKATARPAQ